MNNKISIVIPCHNEEAAIVVVMGKISQMRAVMPEIYEVIVVDDASTDTSAVLLRSFSDVKVVTHSATQGYGAALKTGFRCCTGDLILFMDMDDTYDIQDLPKLYQLFKEKKGEIIFGNRLTSKNGMPGIRKLGNNIYHYCLKLFMLPPIGDPCTGMRLFPIQMRDQFCSLKENDLSYSISLTVHILKNKIPFFETEILYHERIGESKLQTLSDGWKFLWTILCNRLLA